MNATFRPERARAVETAQGGIQLAWADDGRRGWRVGRASQVETATAKQNQMQREKSHVELTLHLTAYLTLRESRILPSSLAWVRLSVSF